MTNRTAADANSDFLISVDAPRIFNTMVDAGVPYYTREHLHRLGVALFQEELSDHSVIGCEFIVARVEKACAAQRALGMRGSWAYEVNLHIGLMIALKAEKQMLAQARTREGVPRLSWNNTFGDAA